MAELEVNAYVAETLTALLQESDADRR